MEPSKPAHAIVTATAGDLPYVEQLARLHSNNIGFVPRAALLDHIERRNVRLLILNGQHAGYTLAGGGKVRPYRLIQVAIAEDLWRKGYGSVLIYDARRTAAEGRCPSMSATIRYGLPMIHVAEATGGHCICTHHRPTARRKATHDYWWPSLTIPENIGLNPDAYDLLIGKDASTATLSGPNVIRKGPHDLHDSHS